MTELAIQDQYADEFAHCYGCGRLNEDGLQIKSYLDGDETVCRFTPAHKHSGGFPGFLYGNVEPLNGQGVFCSHIDITLMSIDGITANDHSLQDRMGV